MSRGKHLRRKQWIGLAVPCSFGLLASSLPGDTAGVCMCTTRSDVQVIMPSTRALILLGSSSLPYTLSVPVGQGPNLDMKQSSDQLTAILTACLCTTYRQGCLWRRTALTHATSGSCLEPAPFATCQGSERCLAETVCRR